MAAEAKARRARGVKRILAVVGWYVLGFFLVWFKKSLQKTDLASRYSE